MSETYGTPAPPITLRATERIDRHLSLVRLGSTVRLADAADVASGYSPRGGSSGTLVALSPYEPNRIYPCILSGACVLGDELHQDDGGMFSTSAGGAVIGTASSNGAIGDVIQFLYQPPSTGGGGGVVALRQTPDPADIAAQESAAAKPTGYESYPVTNRQRYIVQGGVWVRDASYIPVISPAEAAALTEVSDFQRYILQDTSVDPEVNNEVYWQPEDAEHTAGNGFPAFVDPLSTQVLAIRAWPNPANVAALPAPANLPTGYHAIVDTNLGKYIVEDGAWVWDSRYVARVTPSGLAAVTEPNPGQWYEVFDTTTSPEIHQRYHWQPVDGQHTVGDGFPAFVEDRSIILADPPTPVNTYEVIDWSLVTWTVTTSDTTTYDVDWGDGNSETVSSGAPVTHNYASPFTGEIVLTLQGAATVSTLRITDLAGNVSKLPATTTRIEIFSASVMTGTLAVPPLADIVDFLGTGADFTINLASIISDNLVQFRMAGDNTSFGNIGALAIGAPNLGNYYNLGINTATFTGGTIGPVLNSFTDGGGMSSGEVDALLIAFADSVAAAPRAVTINTTGNAARTSASDAAVTAIETAGGTVTP